MNWMTCFWTFFGCTNGVLLFWWLASLLDYVSWENPGYHTAQRNWNIIGLAFFILEASILAGMFG